MLISTNFWRIQGNRSKQDGETIEKKFGWQTNRRQFDVIVKAKTDDNLLTLAAFEELIELNDLIFTAVHDVEEIEISENGEIIMTGNDRKSALKDKALT